MKPDEQRMRDVLVDTIRLLCRTGVEYSRSLRVQGLLGITVDNEHVFLIHVDDFIARNCADVDDRLCGLADECNSPAGIGHVTSDVAVARVSSGSHNASIDLHSNNIYHHQLAPLAKYPNHLSLDQQTHNDILTSVAMSEISSVVAVSSESQDLQSCQPSSQSRQNVPLRENNLPALNPENSSKSADQLTSNGNAIAAGSAASISQSSEPSEVEAENKNRLSLVLKIENDAGEENIADSVPVPPHSESESGMTLCTTAVVNQNQHGPLNLDDMDSSGADTNEDCDSEHTSESEEVSDHVSVARLVSSLQYDPRALVGNMSRWQVGGLQQHSLSDSGADMVPIQPAVLTGVVQSGGSHVSTYYQQQVAFVIFNIYSCHCTNHFS